MYPATKSSSICIGKFCIPQVFAGVIDYKELRRHSVPVPQLGPSAYAVDSVYALLIACIHRRPSSQQSKINMAIRYSSTSQSHVWCRCAPIWFAGRRQGVIAVCHDGLDMSFARFGGSAVVGTNDAWRQVRRSWTSKPMESTAAFLRYRSRPADFCIDLSALPDWDAGWRMAGQHLWPNAEYMRARYPGSSSGRLPYFDAKRVVYGFGKYLARILHEGFGLQGKSG